MTEIALRTIRRLLLVTLWLGSVGLVVELLLLEHFDDWKQYTPLILLVLIVVALGWFGIAGNRASLRAVRILMWLSIVSGAIGVLLHYRGNVEFELEVTPSLGGFALFKAAMMGATPALAPGAMVQLGLVGLAWAFRHPAGRIATDESHS